MTLRTGGCSRSPYASFNVAAHVGDDPLAVAANRALLRGLLPAEPLWLNQVHGTKVLPASEHCGPHTPDADAIWTRERGRICVIMTADCLPILITDRAGTQVAAVHAGWRGLADGIIEEALKTFTDQSMSLLAWLGPCVGSKTFEVGTEVYQAFTAHDPESRQAFVSRSADRWLADLQTLARIRLRRCGVDSIHADTRCTYTDHRRFYSYRRDGQTGRMATLIWIDKSR